MAASGGRALRRFTTAPNPAVVTQAVKELFLCGAGPRKLGQPRIVACITGGGGPFFKYLLDEPGASSCLLEGVVPYDKHSCLSFLAGSNRTAEGIGFCSPEMAQLLAESARDRALTLTAQLVHWPDCVGVSCTATIISHYKRRGDYRAHAAAVDAGGYCSTYHHNLLKGGRERPGEDEACALLALRALADATGRPSAGALAEHGMLLEHDTETENAVGEVAAAGDVETVPERVVRPESHYVSGTCVLVPLPETQTAASVVAPTALPAGTLVVLLPCGTPAQVSDAVAAASTALVALDLGGDGNENKAWGTPQGAVLFVSPHDETRNFPRSLIFEWCL